MILTHYDNAVQVSEYVKERIVALRAKHVGQVVGLSPFSPLLSFYLALQSWKIRDK